MIAPEMRQVKFGHRLISYSVEWRPRRKTVTIAVDPADGVLTKAPCDMDGERLDQVVLSRAPWIVRRLADFEEIGPLPEQHEYVSGESYAYLGRHYRLKVVQAVGCNKPMVKLRGRFIVAYMPDSIGLASRASVRRALIGWYRDHATKKLPERVRLFAGRFGCDEPRALVRDQEKRWGSCSQQGELRFNWRIVMAPMPLVDYVVAHEMCHLREPNHSAAFWRLLRTVMPDYEDRRERLRRNGARYRV